MCTTYEDFPQFYDNPLIQSIAPNERWSISTNKKMPIDIKILQTEQRIAGALFLDERSLVSLPDLCELIPNAANNAYYLDALVDNILILDIEPKCPDNIKEKLLRLPYEYGEISMSGNGFHLAFYLPQNFDDFPIARKKVVMKEEHGYYEILLNHWVTFTRNKIKDAPSDASQTEFEQFFADIASIQKDVQRTDVNIEELEPQDFPCKDRILSLLMQQPYYKTLSDFHDDNSHFEFSFIGFLHYKLGQILNISAIKQAHDYTDNEQVWMLYLVAKERLPYRSKHDEFRDGLPWLLYLSREVIARSNIPDEKKGD